MHKHTYMHKHAYMHNHTHTHHTHTHAPYTHTRTIHTHTHTHIHTHTHTRNLMRPDLHDFLLFETGGSPFSKKFYLIDAHKCTLLPIWLTVVAQCKRSLGSPVSCLGQKS